MTNPKDLIGRTKPGISAIPPASILAMGQAMADGKEKYGLMNWRETKVNADVYYDAVMRHVFAWWDGETVAEDSGVHHLAHAMAGLAILYDASISGVLIDNRPVEGPTPWQIKAFTNNGDQQ